MQLIPIPSSMSATGEAAISGDEVTPLIGGEAPISDVFSQLLQSILALQLQVADGESAADAKVDLDAEVGVEETDADGDASEGKPEDVETAVVAVNVDAQKGLQNALEAVKAAIESRKELASLPLQAVKVGQGESKPVETLPARVAMEKLNELLLGYQQASGGDGADDAASLLNGKAGEKLVEFVKLQMDAADVPRAGVKTETPQLLAATVSGETAAVKESASTSETQTASRPAEPPTIRTVGDFTVRSVRHLLGSEQESIQIRLVPRSLGELHVSVSTVHDRVEVVVTAASGLVRDVLESQLAHLRDALQRDGVDVSRITVHNSSLSDLGGQLAQSQSQAAQRQAQASNHGGNSNAEDRDESALETAGAGQSERSSSHDGDLDLRA